MLHNPMHTGKKGFCFCKSPAAHAHISINKTKHHQVLNSKHPLLLPMLFTLRLQRSSTPSPRISGVIFKTDTHRRKNEVPTYFILQKLFQLNWCLFMTSALLIQHLWVTAGVVCWILMGFPHNQYGKGAHICFIAYILWEGSTVASSNFSCIITNISQHGMIFTLSGKLKFHSRSRCGSWGLSEHSSITCTHTL